MGNNKSVQDEKTRYGAVSDQIKQLLDDAAQEDTAGILGLGRIWLAAEMYDLNEKSHVRATKQERKEHD